MKKLTLLEIVQDILSDLSSDEVNSITDTIESMQVAQIVSTTYAHIIDGRDWPHLYKLFQVTSWADSAYPTYFTLPEKVDTLLWIKYDKKKVVYKDPIAFIELLDSRINATNKTDIIDQSGITLYVYNDRNPSYWTSFDDTTIVMDAYDSSVDTTLQTQKTECYGKELPVFTLADSFVPNLPAQMFSYLVAEAKAHASLVLQQAPDSKAQEYSVTQRRRMSLESWRMNGGISVPNYGRKQ